MGIESAPAYPPKDVPHKVPSHPPVRVDKENAQMDHEEHDVAEQDAEDWLSDSFQEASLLSFTPARYQKALRVFGGNSKVGHASYYGPGLYNKAPMAAGGKLYPDTVAVAHKTLPLGTPLMVTNLANNKQVRVVVLDRGPYIPGREIDLTEAAFRRIASPKAGVLKTRIDILPPTARA